MAHSVQVSDGPLQVRDGPLCLRTGHMPFSVETKVVRRHRRRRVGDVHPITVKANSAATGSLLATYVSFSFLDADY